MGVSRDVMRSSDGDFAVSLTGGHTARLISTKTGECIRVFEGHKDDVVSVCFSQVRAPRCGRPGYPAAVKSPRCLPELPASTMYFKQTHVPSKDFTLSSTGSLLNGMRTGSRGMASSRSEPFLRSIRPVSPAPKESPRRIFGSPPLEQGMAAKRRGLKLE